MIRFATLFLVFPLLAQQADWRTIEWNGRQVRGQVADGDFIVEGDIVLGSVERLELQALSSKTPVRQSSITPFESRRWPSGVIPYIIDDTVPNQGRIDGALAHWNEKTSIKLVPRTTEVDYIRFRQNNGGSCNSNVGRIGGPQTINLPDSCSQGSIIHEIGHTVGFWHTQSRQDRGAHVRVRLDNIGPLYWDQFTQQFTGGVDIGPYAYDSIMHYGPAGDSKGALVAIETLPAGIPLGQRVGLTASDIDTAQRMYGRPVQCCVIATNPDGLDVIVDGAKVTAPASFNWSDGSTHTIRADSTAFTGGRNQFARWSDYGAQTHTIRASNDATVYTAHFSVQSKDPLTSGAGGKIVVSPFFPDGYYPVGSQVSVQPIPDNGFSQVNWSGFGLFSIFGDAPNPLVSILGAATTNYQARFTNLPVTRIESNPPGLQVNVDASPRTAPRVFTWTAGTNHTLKIDQSVQTLDIGGVEATFDNWSIGNAPTQIVTASAGGETITANFRVRYRVTLTAGIGGTARISGVTSGAFFASGSQVQLIATPSAGYLFTGWSGDAGGADPNLSVPADKELVINANFAQPNFLNSAGVVNGASFVSGAVAPGQIITVFGNQIGPADLITARLNAQGLIDTTLANTQVLFDGRAAPLVYVSANQISAIVPYAVAGRSATTVQVNNNGKLTNSLALAIATAAPALFTAASSGRGPAAILNENGSFNSASNPAARGSIVVLFGTGEGATTPAGVDGKLTAAPLPKPNQPVMLRIGDQVANLEYIGGAPGLVAGLLQINARVPDNLAAGEVPVTLQIGSVASPRSATVFVK